MRTSHRYHVRLAPAVAKELEAFAQKHGLGLSSAIRLLATKGLEAESLAGGISPKRESPAALAALVASELVILMVASVLPEGEQRMRSLAERAFQAAEERLAMFSEPTASEQ
jgi:hypothetical protein